MQAGSHIAEAILDHLLALRTFARIVEAGSLAKAAASLNLPRSSVSKLLQDLEAHVGVPLVTRSTRATRITPEGEEYYQRAIRLLFDLDEMDAAVRGPSAKASGRLRVDVGSSIANLVLIPKLPDFIASYPDIELILGVSDRSVDLIGDGVDCVIRGGALSDSSLIARRLGELAFVTCAAPAYVKRYGLPDSVADLVANHRALRYFSASTGANFPLRFFEEGQMREVHPRLHVAVNESTAHMTALLAGLGIGQTFEFVARPYLADGHLIDIFPPLQPKPFPLHLIYPAGRTQDGKLRAFADWVIEIFASIARK